MSYFDIELFLNYAKHLAIAMVLTLPVAFNREYKTNNAGLRTFPLVAIASCAFVMLGQGEFKNSVEAQARVVYGVITGMGFIGGGSIIKHRNRIGGTATAAGMWNTAAIGVAVALSAYELAVLLSISGFIVFQCFSPIKHQKDSLTKPKQERIDSNKEDR